VSTPAQAGQSHTGSTLRQLDARIRDAEEHIRTWDRRIVRWNRKVGKVSVKVQQVRQREATLGSGPPLDVLSRHTPRSRLFPYLAARAERAFRAILHDPEAKNAQQQIGLRARVFVEGEHLDGGFAFLEDASQACLPLMPEVACMREAAVSA